MNELQNMSGVYIITCTCNNKFYIGSTENFNERYEQHSMDCRNCTFKIKEMNEDANKYGSNKFKFDILCTCNYKVLTIVENHFIKLYNAKKNGYNMRYASKKFKAKGRYSYTPCSSAGKVEERDRALLDSYLSVLVDLDKDEKTFINLSQLIDCVNLEICNYKYMNPVIDLIKKLDYNCYLKMDNIDENIIYKISGKQITNLYNGGYFLKSFKEVDEGFRRRLSKVRTDYFYIEINNIKDDLDIDYSANKEYIDKYNIMDLRYNPYNIFNY